MTAQKENATGRTSNLHTTMSAKERRKYRVDHGQCPECGEESAPYYLCTNHRQIGAIHRLMTKMSERGIVKKEKEGNKVYWSIPPGWEQFDTISDFRWGKTLFEMESDDKRLKPRLGRRPIDLDETLVSIFMESGRRLQMEEILEAWGNLRSKRKHQSLAGDMTALIAAQRKRDERNAKRARIHRVEREDYANAAQ